MDRTMIAASKADEKDLSKSIYNALQGLAIFQPFSEEMKKCCTEDMFIKPNQHAFFHVMHFLLCLYDAAEFKKRFCWPITDRQGESWFRTSTVEYLKHISTKHNLQWNIKSHLAVIPGGHKFIHFLLQLINLVVQECKAQRERQLPNEVKEIAGKTINWNLDCIIVPNKSLKNFVAKFVTDIDEATSKYSEKTAVLNEQLQQMANKAGVPVRVLLSEEFSREFHASNIAAFENKQIRFAQELLHLQNALKSLKTITEQRLHNDKNSNKTEVLSVLRSISDKHAGKFAVHEEISMETLITAFNCIHNESMLLLQAANQATFSTEYIKMEMQKVQAEFQDAKMQLNDLQAQQNCAESYSPKSNSSAQSHNSCKHLAANGLMSKYVSTPPIRLCLPQAARNLSARISLWDCQTTDNMDSFLSQTQFNPIAESSIIKPARLNPSLQSLNSTITGSKLTDANLMISSLLKSTKKVAASKTFDQEQLDESSALDTSSSKDARTLLHNFSPNVKAHLLDIQRLRNESANAELLLQKKKLTAVEKVQNNLCDLHNLSTSPSGRLPTLTYETQWNDSYIQQTQIEHKNFMQNTALNSENKENATEQKTSLPSIKIPEDQEELFNISDSVLLDISN